MTISVSIQRTPKALIASWTVPDFLCRDVFIPSLSTEIQRKDLLWQSTCVEIFWGSPDQPEYYEVNLSPSGDFQIYHFTGERTGQTQTPFALHAWHRTQDQASLALSCEIPLPNQHQQVPLQVGMTCILEHLDHSISYWALRHPDPTRADFHTRKAWTITLPTMENAGLSQMPHKEDLVLFKIPTIL